MKKTVKSLWLSALSILLCLAMLAGSTFAWFTDSVESAGNMIVAGNLDIEMYWAKDLSGSWINAEDRNTEPVFDYDLWEPGYTEVRYVKIVNAGSLAFKYALSIIVDGEVSALADVIDVYFVEAPTTPIDGREDLADMTPTGTLRQAINGTIPANGVLLAANQTKAGFYSGEIVVAIALKMKEEAGNEYQNLSIGDGFYLRLDATQYDFENDAFGSDYDSNVQLPGPIVDSEGTVAVTPVNGLVPAGGVAIDAGNGITANVPEGVKMKSGANALTLSVANMSETGANLFMGESEQQTSLDVHIEGVATDNTVPMEITVERAAAKGLNSTSLKLYHVENGATVQMTLIGLNDAFTAHNQFKYDPATGNITLYMATFSEIAMTTKTNNKWEGGFDYSWYDENATELYIANADQLAAFGAIVGGMYKVTGRADNKYTYSNEVIKDSFANKTVYLVCDIYIGDLTDEDGRNVMFYPIGYYNNTGKYDKVAGNVGGTSGTDAIVSGYYNFEGTFDGQGHVISDWYQNTWEAFGDYNDGYSGTPNHSRDGFGLFGRVYGATIKNLIINNFSSDGEFATTGCVAAYADFGATFENISIFNSNPRVYNIGNGGVVGCVGWYTKGETETPVTFRNITVDNSNKITALWGSWDVACGGIVGQYYPTSGQSSANYPKNAGIYFENCHVAAQIDVYNDVCANYQYYAYRYAGILMGSVRENVTENGHEYPKMDGITAKNCTVHFGDWNDYYYCELVANSLASYTHDHQMSRLVQVQSVDVVNKTVTDLNGVTTAIPTSGRQNYVVVNKNGDGTWNHGDGKDHATCYHFVNGVQHFHDKADSDNPNVYETVDGKEVLKEDKQCIYREFNNLVTGYGWGVTSKGIGQMDGVTLLDDTKNSPDSVEKFEATQITTEENEFAIKLKELFAVNSENTKYAIKPESIQVTVTNVTDSTGNTYDPNGKVTYKLERNINDWEESTITFSGEGWVKVTIQDYYYCKPTSIVINVTKATMNLLLKGEELLDKATTDKTDGIVRLSVGVDKANTTLTSDGYVHVVAANSNGSATSYNIETYFYLLTGNKGNNRIETGKYFVMKYRVPEKADPYSNFTGMQVYTDSANDDHAQSEEAFNYNVIDTDGEWHILVIDLSKSTTSAEHYVADEYGRYYGNFVRVDIFANVPTGQAMDIEFVGMASSMAEIENAVNDIQSAANYNSDNKVGHYAYIENSNTPTLVPMANHSNVVDGSVFIPEDKIATGIEYVACVDFANIYQGLGSIYEPVNGGYTTSSNAINTISFNNRSAYTLYINGWAVVDGGVKNYVWSADGGNTWRNLNTIGGKANDAMIKNANEYHYGNYTFAGDYEHASFQSEAMLKIDFTGTGYSGTKDIIIAAIPNNDTSKYLVLTVIKDVNIVSSSMGIYNCDADSYVDDSLYALTSKAYSMNITVANGVTGTVIPADNEINPSSVKRIVRAVYSSGSTLGDVPYLENDKSISSVKFSVSDVKVNGTEGGIKKYVWSYDGTVWYDVEADNDGYKIDFAKLLADKPWLNNRIISVTIAAIPNTDAIPDDGKIELCVLMRLVDFRIATKAGQVCTEDNHVKMATSEYALDANGYVIKVTNCYCGKEQLVDETFDPKYLVHFDYIGNNANSSSNTRFSNVDSVVITGATTTTTYTGATELDASGYNTSTGVRFSFITTETGKLYISGWAGLDGGFNQMKYRVTDDNGNVGEWIDFTLGADQKAGDSYNVYDQIKNYYKINDPGRRFSISGNVIDLSEYLVTNDDSVTLEFAFVYSDAYITLGDDALVYAGKFTNIRKVGCANGEHVMLASKYVVGDDGYVKLQTSSCMCGEPSNIKIEDVNPTYAIHFDTIGTLGSTTTGAGTRFHNVVNISNKAPVTDSYNATGYYNSQDLNKTTLKSFTTDSDGKLAFAGWLGAQDGVSGLRYRVVYKDETGAETTTDWYTINLSTLNEKDSIHSALLTQYSIDGKVGKRFNTTLNLKTYLTNGQNADGVTIELAFVYTPAAETLGNDGIVYAGTFTNVMLGQ